MFDGFKHGKDSSKLSNWTVPLQVNLLLSDSPYKNDPGSGKRAF